MNPESEERDRRGRCDMVRWRAFEQSAPHIASAGRRLLELNEVAFLATVSKTGRPRIHPFVPKIVDCRLVAFVMDSSPKIADLRQRAQFSIHALPGAEDEEFSVSGKPVCCDTNTELRRRLPKLWDSSPASTSTTFCSNSHSTERFGQDGWTSEHRNIVHTTSVGSQNLPRRAIERRMEVAYLREFFVAADPRRGMNQGNLAVATDPRLAEIWISGTRDRASLTEADRHRFDMLLLSYFHVFDTLFYSAKTGTGEQQLLRAEERGFAHLLGLQGVRDWWEQNPYAFSPDFRSYMEGLGTARAV